VLAFLYSLWIGQSFKVLIEHGDLLPITLRCDTSSVFMALKVIDLELTCDLGLLIVDFEKIENLK
jgi:hypothetical protein